MKPPANISLGEGSDHRMSSSVSEEWQIFSKGDFTFAYLRSAPCLYHAAEMTVKISFIKLPH